MPLFVVNRRTAQKTLEQRFDHPEVLDVTSGGPEPWVRFSPFYPHGTIPVPFSPGVTAQSVEGVWQGLKVFERQGVDLSKFEITSMKGLKRSVRRFGRVLGHRKGVDGAELLPYRDARLLLYLPTYRWVVENRLTVRLDELRRLASERTVVLLDYTTNGDVDDVSRPLSHAALIQRYVEGNWPT